MAGLVLLWSSLGEDLTRLSYDLPFLIRPELAVTNAVIVYMDEQSLRELKQKPDQWDRSLHARLLDRLTADACRLVVFDV